MADCRCLTPAFDYRDYDSHSLGVDTTDGRFGEATVLTCKICGATWLNYFLENEGFERSARWYRGLVTAEQLTGLTPGQVPTLLAGLAWYFYGGSYFGTTGRRGSGPLWLDRNDPPPTAHLSALSNAADSHRESASSTQPLPYDTVGFDDAGVWYTNSASLTHRLAWSKLRTVEIVITNHRLFDDFYWFLHGDGTILKIPQTAEGSAALLARLQQLPGFDNEAVISACASTANQRYRCWQASG